MSSSSHPSTSGVSSVVVGNGGVSESTTTTTTTTPDWDIVRVTSENVGLDMKQTRAVVNLLDNDNTVPFISRYRRQATGPLTIDKIRDVATCLKTLHSVKEKAISAVKMLSKLTTTNCPDTVKTAVCQSLTVDEIEHIIGPYKPGATTTLAARARKLGLSELADDILAGHPLNVINFINVNIEGLSTHEEILKGVSHIIADIISKHPDTINLMNNMLNGSESIYTSSVKVKNSTTAAATSQNNNKNKGINNGRYLNFNCPVRRLQSHQIMAINRNEKLKMITVKIDIPTNKEGLFLEYVRNFFCKSSTLPSLVAGSVDDSYHRLMLPSYRRRVRSELTKKAEKESVEIFSKNLKKLILTPPLKGKVVLGVDPGYAHGCKIAVVSPTGSVLVTSVVYLHDKRSKEAEDELFSLMMSYNCETVAIGNGCACRVAEQFFSEMIEKGAFAHLNVVYCIVDECGTSIYSISDIAVKELPLLEPIHRSAVSIARRLQDPLAELVKIDPRHMGIGMYQHDIDEKILLHSLDSVVQECVSFVGVDVNVCSETLLSKTAGLNRLQASNIVRHRNEVGPFTNRQQLLAVSGIGPKTFQQCIGFIRIDLKSCGSDIIFSTGDSVIEISSETDSDSETVVDDSVIIVDNTPGCKRKREDDTGVDDTVPKKKRVKKTHNEDNDLPCLFDMTSIHPESYSVARKFLELIGGSEEEIGSSQLNEAVKQSTAKQSLNNWATLLETDADTLQLIIDGFIQIGHDLREDNQKPLFKSNLQKMEDLTVGALVTGRVTNVTSFGVFVDIGISVDGLIHTSGMGNLCSTDLGPGDRVKVKVLSIEKMRGRIGLQFVQLS